MNCYFHEQRNAVRKCNVCGKEFCAECNEVTGDSGMCPVCRKKHLKKELQRLKDVRSRKLNKSIFCVFFTVLFVLVGVFIPQTEIVAFLCALVAVIVFGYNVYGCSAAKKDLKITESQLMRVDALLKEILAEIRDSLKKDNKKSLFADDSGN